MRSRSGLPQLIEISESVTAIGLTFVGHYVVVVAVRVAGAGDFEVIVATLRIRRLSPLVAWALAPAPDLVEAQHAYVKWLTAGLLSVGNVWLGDDGTVVGGRRLRLRLADRLRPRNPAHGDVEVSDGAYSFPDVPPRCRRRLLGLSAAGLQLRSSGRRTFLTQIWDPATDDNGIEPLQHLVAHARAIRHSCLIVTTGQARTERLRHAGFAPGREAPAGEDGRPAMTAWEVLV